MSADNGDRPRSTPERRSAPDDSAPNQASTTRLSSRGQVVIPEEIRDRLGLKPGARFVVLGEGDVVVLKAIQAPDMAEFDELVHRARESAKRAGLTEEDVDEAIRRVREGA